MYKKIDRIQIELDNLEKSIELTEDWSQKNQFKIYKGVLSLYNRDIPKANECLIVSISTFSTYDLLSYDNFVLQHRII